MSEFIVGDETQIKIGKDYFWIWVALESDNKTIVGVHLSVERNMLVAEKQFLQNIIKKYGKHPVSSDRGTWYVPAYKFLKLKHTISIHHLRKAS